MKKFIIRFIKNTEDYHRQLKIIAAEKKITFNDLLLEIIKEFLIKNKK